MCDLSVVQEATELTRAQVIAFWEEYDTVTDRRATRKLMQDFDRYLEREFLATYQNSRIVLLRPAMSFMLLQTPDPRVITVRDHLYETERCLTKI